MKLEDDYFTGNFFTNLDSVLKSKDITLLTNVHIIKAMVFSLIMYGCENWTIKKVKSQTVDPLN